MRKRIACGTVAINVQKKQVDSSSNKGIEEWATLKFQATPNHSLCLLYVH